MGKLIKRILSIVCIILIVRWCYVKYTSLEENKKQEVSQTMKQTVDTITETALYPEETIADSISDLGDVIDEINGIDNTCYIGDTIANIDGVEFCVTSVNDMKSIGSGYFASTTDYNYIEVGIKIINNSKEAYDVNVSAFSLIDEDGNQYDYCSDALMSVENHMYIDTINPSLSKEYVVVYEVPYESTEKDWQLQVLYNYFSSRNMVYITLKEEQV